MKKMAVIIFLGMFFVLSTGNTLTPVYANEEVQELSPIVVTASPVRDSVIGDFSTSKVIYTAEDIEKMKTNDVAGVLNNISSVSLMGEGIFGSRTVGRNRIKIRGHNAKIMIDGRPVSMEVFNCVINNVLTLNGIKRIEITRSGEAVLSGTDGLGGVINIITRTPGKYRSQFSGKFGTDNSGVASLLTENSFDDYYYSLNYEHKTTDGHIENTALNSNDFFLKTGYFLTDNIRLEFSGKYYDGEYEDPIDEVDWDKDRYGINFNIDGNWENQSFLIQFHATYGEHKNYLLDTGTLDFHSKDKMEGIRSYHKINFDSFELLYGLDYRKYGGEIIDQVWANEGEHTENEYAPHLVLKKELGGYEFIAGGRYNYNSLYDGIFLHKLGLKREFSDVLSVNLSSNKSFRTPSVLQSQIHRFKSNEDLEPEVATSYQLNSSYSGLDIFDAKAGFFIIDGKDRIVDSGGSFENVDDYTHHGAELNLSKQLSDNLFASLGYTYLDPDDDTKFQFRHKIAGQFDYSLHSFRLNTAYSYINKFYAETNQEERLPDYFKLDVKASCDYSDDVSYFIEADNLLDVDYATQTYANGEKLYNSGLTVMAGLNATF